MNVNNTESLQYKKYFFLFYGFLFVSNLAKEMRYVLSKKKTQPKKPPPRRSQSSPEPEPSRQCPAPPARSSAAAARRLHTAGPAARADRAQPRRLRTFPAPLRGCPGGGRTRPPAAPQPGNRQKPLAPAPSQRREAGIGARENGSSAAAALHSSDGGSPSHSGHRQRVRCPQPPAHRTHPHRAAPAPPPPRSPLLSGPGAADGPAAGHAPVTPPPMGAAAACR